MREVVASTAMVLEAEESMVQYLAVVAHKENYTATVGEEAQTLVPSRTQRKLLRLRSHMGSREEAGCTARVAAAVQREVEVDEAAAQSHMLSAAHSQQTAVAAVWIAEECSIAPESE